MGFFAKFARNSWLFFRPSKFPFLLLSVFFTLGLVSALLINRILINAIDEVFFVLYCLLTAVIIIGSTLISCSLRSSLKSFRLSKHEFARYVRFNRWFFIFNEVVESDITTLKKLHRKKNYERRNSFPSTKPIPIEKIIADYFE